jgi:hypothetical protein
MFSRGKKRVLISCCSNRNPEWATVLSIQDAMRDVAKNGCDVTFKPRVGESLICRARQNDLVEFMQRGFDYLFSIDDDVSIAPDTITKLVKNDKDVVAGVYRLGQDATAAAVRLPIDTDGPSWNEVLRKNLLTPAIYVSTGCMMIRRNVVEGMIDKYTELYYKRNVVGDRAWALYMPFIHNEEYLSEDWAFCQRAMDAGFEIWVDGGLKCGHWKTKLFMFGE